MSGGVNVKSAPRGPPSSGIPLPRSLLPSSPKADPRRRATDLPRPSSQTPKYTPTHTPTHTPTQSPSLCPRSSSIPGPSSRDLLGDASLKSQLFQRKGNLAAPLVSRSAYSSPLTQRRPPPPHSKDTLDLGKPAVPQTSTQLPHNGNHNRNTFSNKNQAWGASNHCPRQQFSTGDNYNSETAAEAMPRREDPPENQSAHSTMLNNGNLRPSLAHTIYEHTIRGRSNSMSQSDEEMGTSEDSSPASSPRPLPLPPITFTLPGTLKMAVDTQDQNLDKGAASTETPRVNMATVAPFSYRRVAHIHTSHTRRHVIMTSIMSTHSLVIT
ncbi:uncharacterized protein LOC118110895 [Hippoglossus stenolepis]|uniref:uncharacterized protein LOC118110895 n=1 Tax=Hippoglossus stenolepis TaxID=195615 RepID=UPI001FAF2B1E|nr:uncharacterized protein LOC118110895 [Hippoglossus stenolepis]